MCCYGDDVPIHKSYMVAIGYGMLHVSCVVESMVLLYLASYNTVHVHTH